ncbi:2-dehydropantoate 2-reductase N-terminal domain-containing protein [Mesorhizobium sp.]|uniref:2-dehydropantoate 2-reductase N-terminal domain-containing protein n=1 Tax=Mesorhizobium sp. TaxID=1871066 RepID=UPI00345BC3E6
MACGSATSMAATAASRPRRFPSPPIRPRPLAGANIVLVTVKSGATEEMAALIAAHASPEAVVVSLQNGVDNAEKLRAGLAGRHVLAAWCRSMSCSPRMRRRFTCIAPARAK